MKTIKISQKSYDYLKRRSLEDRRPLTSTLDLIIEAEERNDKSKKAKKD